MQLSGFTNNFAAGEITPDAWERTDLQQAQAGCAEARNFLGLVTGPNASRGGFYRRGVPKFENKATRYIPWLVRDGEGLVLELGDGYARVWTARGAKVLNGATHVEFSQPFAAALLPGLRFCQVGDVMIFTSRDGANPQVIRRLSNISWTSGDYVLNEGPWLPENTDDSRTLTWQETSPGVMAVQSNFPLFNASYIGALFRLRGGFGGYRTWAPETAFSVGEKAVSAGRIYENIGGGVSGLTGNTPLVHDRGTVGDGNLAWTFLHDGAGVVRITSVIDSNNAVAQILAAPPYADTPPTSSAIWSEGAFSLARGYPTAQPAIREERLALAATSGQPGTIELTRTAGFNAVGADFKPGLGTGQVVDDDAVRIECGAGARVVWLVDAMNLVVGTTDAEWLLSGGTVDDPIAPGSSTVRRLSSQGSADVMPVVVQGPPAILLHVARGGKTLREIQLAPNQAAGGRDLSLLGQHLFGLGVIEMAWTRPDNVLWLRLADGSLAAFTYHIEHGVMGVRRQEIAGGWLAESLCAAPGPDGRDRLTVGVTRTKDGVAQRAHLVLALREDGVFMDLAERYQGGAVSSITGLGHLNGETVRVVVAGSVLTEGPVAGGAIALPEPVTDAWVGVKLRRRFVSLPLDPQGPGSMLARPARPVKARVVLDCVEASVGVEPLDPVEPAQLFEVVTTRRPSDVAPTVRRARDGVTFAAGTDRDNRVVVDTDQPYDLVIHAVAPVFSAS